jgi:curved DNA-binding protein CbpA
MLTPFEILDVAEDADDATIKKAYLKKVREFPPEHNAEAFQRVRTAYEHIRTDKQRRMYRLFQRDKPDFSALLERALAPGAPQRPDAGTLIAVLTESVADDLLNLIKRQQ